MAGAVKAAAGVPGKGTAAKAAPSKRPAKRPAKKAATSPAASPTDAGDVVDQDDEISQSSGKPAGQPKQAAPAKASPAPAMRLPTAPPRVEDGAGFLLGLLTWGWLIMPFLKGGTPEVRKVLKAKFFNKAPDGTWLP